MTASLDRWDDFSSGAVLRAVAGVAPSVAHHSFARPFRRPIGGDAYTGALGRLARRVFCGFFDATVALMIQGYEELTGLRLGPPDGAVGVLFIRVLSALDDELDRRMSAGESLVLDDVLRGPIISARLDAWERLVGESPHYAELMDQYWAVGAQTFDAYVARSARPDFRTDVAGQLDAVQLDSGEQLQWLVRTWAMLNEHPLHSSALGQFFDLGVAGKLADDLADVALDTRTRTNNNVVNAMLIAHPEEKRHADEAMSAGTRLSLPWWREHCPKTLGQFSDEFFWYFDRLDSESLRRAGTLKWCPAEWCTTGHRVGRGDDV